MLLCHQHQNTWISLEYYDRAPVLNASTENINSHWNQRAMETNQLLSRETDWIGVYSLIHWMKHPCAWVLGTILGTILRSPLSLWNCSYNGLKQCRNLVLVLCTGVNFTCYEQLKSGVLSILKEFSPLSDLCGSSRGSPGNVWHFAGIWLILY